MSTPMSVAEAEKKLWEAEAALRAVAEHAPYITIQDKKTLFQTSRVARLHAKRMGGHYAQQERDRK